jgi:transcriptional regulator with XRE-family HTH domain
MTRLEALRKGRGWSVSRLARESGINRVTVSEIINGRRIPTAHYRERLSATLGWPLEKAAELMEETDDA